jgi:hypothetical protein
VTTREQVAVLRAIAEGDLDRHTQLRDDFQAADQLEGYQAVLAAAFRVAVGRRLPGRYRHEDVVNLIAEARIAIDPTSLALDPADAELIVRSILDDTVDLGDVSDSVYPRVYRLVCSYLAARQELGDPDTFMTEVGEVLDDATTPGVSRRRREVRAEDATVLAGMVVGLVAGVGLAAALGAVTARRCHHRPPL